MYKNNIVENEWYYDQLHYYERLTVKQALWAINVREELEAKNSGPLEKVNMEDGTTGIPICRLLTIAQWAQHKKTRNTAERSLPDQPQSTGPDFLIGFWQRMNGHFARP